MLPRFKVWFAKSPGMYLLVVVEILIYVWWTKDTEELDTGSILRTPLRNKQVRHMNEAGGNRQVYCLCFNLLLW